MGGVGNGAAKEDWHGDLNPGTAAIGKRGPCSSEGKEEDHAVLEERRGPYGFGVLLFATWLRQQERLCWEEKGRKDSCWWAMRRCHMVLD